MSLRLPELQELDLKIQIVRIEEIKQESQKDINEVLYYQGFLYILKIIKTELIC